MTERTASGRARSALKAIGMDETPVSVLEREDALFVLTPGTLVYQDGGGTRRVTLRDLTRIHSDEQGVLRVETPAGTALTATLLGFDVAQVQAFFAQVRDTTARAKEQPVSPLPTPGGPKTFSSPPAPPASVNAQAAATPPKPPTVEEPVSRPPARTAPVAPSTVTTARPDTPATGTPSPAAPLAAAPAQPTTPAPVPTTPARPPAEPPAARPVVISSSAFTPSAARTPAQVTEPPRAQERPAPAVPTPTPVLPPATEAPVLASAPAPAARLDALARQADAVEGLTGRLRFLGGVLFLAALALAVVQFQSGARLDGLWTLLSGGVGTIALLALADMARLLVLSARAGRGADTTDDR